MSGPQASLLPDGRRLHLQHGPIDLVIEAFGELPEVARAYGQAKDCFRGVLAGLAPELPVLRMPVGTEPATVQGPVARRMVAATWMHSRVHVTPMAAVAGAVADEVLEALLAGRRLQRAYVNDGGDIALYLATGQRFDIGLVTRVETGAVDGSIAIDSATAVRGVATSGQGGRSFSLGVADAVTVLARSAAAADVAATLVANAIDVAPDHPAVRRVPASALDPDTDLGAQPVTVEVGELAPDEVDGALAAGVTCARGMLAAELIEAAVLCLQGEVRVVSVLGDGAPFGDSLRELRLV